MMGCSVRYGNLRNQLRLIACGISVISEHGLNFIHQDRRCINNFFEQMRLVIQRHNLRTMVTYDQKAIGWIETPPPLPPPNG